MQFSAPASTVPLHPGYIAGNWYQPASGSVASGGAVAANRIALVPFVLLKSIHIQALGVRIATAAAAGNCQAAVYTHNSATGRPTGAALCSTANMSTASATTVSAAASATLAPGVYWLAINQDNATVTYQSLATTTPQQSILIGSSTIGNVASTSNSAALSLFVTQTFGTWPDLTSASFTEQMNNSHAIVFLQAA